MPPSISPSSSSSAAAAALSHSQLASRLLQSLQSISPPSPSTATSVAASTGASAIPHFTLSSQDAATGSVSVLPSPSSFHETLCHKIRHAQRRVYLASLYAGPAVSTTKPNTEQDLLDALARVQRDRVDVQVLLDYNRGTRPVSTESPSSTTTTSSAKAVQESLRQVGQLHGKNNDSDGLSLYQVLQEPWKSWLPSPLNEVMGVFHIKVCLYVYIYTFEQRIE